MDPGMFGGILGSVAGVLGGIIGTYASFSRARTPQERRYLIRCALGFSVGISAFLVGLFLLPLHARWLLWIPYSIALPISILATNRGIGRLRAEAAGGGGSLEA